MGHCHMLSGLGGGDRNPLETLLVLVCWPWAAADGDIGVLPPCRVLLR